MEEASDFDLSSVKNGITLKVTVSLISCALCLLLILAFLSLTIQSKSLLTDVAMLKMKNASFLGVPRVGNA